MLVPMRLRPAALLVLLCMVQRSMQLRTGVAPTYIPTMRQISSYETNHIDTYNDAITTLRTLELEQETLHAAKKVVKDHKDDERAHTDDLISQNVALRATYVQNLNNKVFEDDWSFYQIIRNRGLEPLNVNLTAEKETQDNFIHYTNWSNDFLNAHAAQTQTQNDALQTEKQTVWLSLESQERAEWWYHENAIAVESQNPKEAIRKEYFEEQNVLHDMYISDLTQRNTDLAATVPGLTADRDAQEAAKLDNEIAKKDFELQAASEEQHTAALQKSKATLEKLIMQHQMANYDLTTYNAALTGDINTLTAERDALRNSYEELTNQRNTAQIQGDYYEVLWHDTTTMLKKLTPRIAGELSDWTNMESVCTTRNNALVSQKAALVATNANLQAKCY